jgi:palmitoyltransferase ZDHHC9/14/18
MSSSQQRDDDTTTLLVENWPSKNVLLCSGRIMLGKDIKFLLLSIVLILLPAFAFEAFITTYFYIHVHIAVGIVLTVLPIVSLCYIFVALFLTSTMDPGILPRKSVVFNTITEEKELTELTTKFPSDTQTVNVNGKEIVLKYCYTCELYRPPRSSHCSTCNNCVERFDHHCPWTGTCIGKRNYRPYMHFIGSATVSLITAIVLCLLQISLSCYKLSKKYTQDVKTIWAILCTCAAVPLIIYCMVALGFVGLLLSYHSYLICSNQTTMEREKRKKGIPVPDFSKGVCRNIFQDHLFAPIEPSRIPFRKPLSTYRIETQYQINSYAMSNTCYESNEPLL